jgi:Outer membrane efflux protein
MMPLLWPRGLERSIPKPPEARPMSDVQQPVSGMRRTGATALACVLLTALLPLPATAQIVQRLISTALDTHPQTLSQRALVQSAAAGVDGARWQFYPTPSVSVEAAGASASDRLYQGDNRVSTLRLQQPLWTGGRLTAGVDRAEAGLAASQAGLDDVRQQLALRWRPISRRWSLKKAWPPISACAIRSDAGSTRVCRRRAMPHWPRPGWSP